MQHYPIFVNLAGKTVIVSGAGSTAVPKIRLLLKTNAKVKVFGENPHLEIIHWDQSGLVSLYKRSLKKSDVDGSTLLYAANSDIEKDQEVLSFGQELGVLVNVVDNLQLSEFITPAIVDRDPVTIAIGTEGNAPVLARKIKSFIEDLLPNNLGLITSYSAKFRDKVSKALKSHDVRHMWANFYSKVFNPKFKLDSLEEIRYEIETSLGETINQSRKVIRLNLVAIHHERLDLLGRRTRNIIDNADVILQLQTIPKPILEMARREAEIVNLQQYSKQTSQSIPKIIGQQLQSAVPGQSLILAGSSHEEIQKILSKVHGIKMNSMSLITLPSGTRVEIQSIIERDKVVSISPTHSVVMEKT